MAEVEFREWTRAGVMRARPTRACATTGRRPRWSARTVAARRRRRRPAAGGRDGAPEALFESVERLPDGSLAVVIDGRRLKISNWDKVLYPQTGFTKGDLIAYYARIAPAVLPHLQDRPLTLKRYPNGVDEPVLLREAVALAPARWVQTARIGASTTRSAQDRPTLVWLANLADIELHTSLALRARPSARRCWCSTSTRAARGHRGVLRGRARATRAVRGARAGERRQDVGLQGHAGLRAAQRRRSTYEQTKPFARRSPSCSSSGCPSSSSRA